MREYLNSLVPLFKDKRIPVFGLFELTPLCNFNCNMCYIHLSNEQLQKQGKLLTAEQWIEIGRQAKENGALFLELTGGEIFTRADFRYIYENLYDMGLLLLLRSNGYLINEKAIEWLKKRPPYLLCITLYGGSDSTCQEISGIKDGFTVVSENLKKIREAQIAVQLSMTLTKDNIHDYFLVRSWAEKNDIPFTGGYSALISPFSNTGRAVEDKRIYDSRAAEFKGFEECDDIDAGVILGHEYQESPFARCSKFGAKFSVSWDGKLMLCNILRSIGEDLQILTFKEAYKSLYRKLDQLKRPEKCRECKYDPFCQNCPASLFAESGDPETINEGICERAKIKWYTYYTKKSGK